MIKYIFLFAFNILTTTVRSQNNKVFFELINLFHGKENFIDSNKYQNSMQKNSVLEYYLGYEKKINKDKVLQIKFAYNSTNSNSNDKYVNTITNYSQNFLSKGKANYLNFGLGYGFYNKIKKYSLTTTLNIDTRLKYGEITYNSNVIKDNNTGNITYDNLLAIKYPSELITTFYMQNYLAINFFKNLELGVSINIGQNILSRSGYYLFTEKNFNNVKSYSKFNELTTSEFVFFPLIKIGYEFGKKK